MLHHVTEEKIRVRYGETDQMGHAYYANYLFWFEQARGAWCLVPRPGLLLPRHGGDGLLPARR